MAGNRCAPISSTKTGRVSAAAISQVAPQQGLLGLLARRAFGIAARPTAEPAARRSPTASTASMQQRRRLPSRSPWRRSVARLTLADATPGTASSARSTRATQEAQVMPSMAKSTVCGGHGIARPVDRRDQSRAVDRCR